MTVTAAGRALRWGGGALVVAALTLLAWALSITLPVGESAVGVPGVRLAGDLLLLAACLLLAVGLPGAPGIVGRSAVGRVALVVLGGQGVGFALLGLAVPEGATTVLPALVVVNLVWQAAVLVAAVVAAVVVARAGVLRGIGRLSFVPVGVAQVLVTGLQLVPSAAVVPVLDVLGVLQPLALLAAGAGITVQGRGSRDRAGAVLAGDRP